MGVEWGEPAETHDSLWTGRWKAGAVAEHGASPAGNTQRNADQGADQTADRESRGTDQAADRDRPLVLTDPERRAAEYHRYRAIVDRTVGAARAWSEAVPGFRSARERISPDQSPETGTAGPRG